jgi:peptide/bleomycin uptake transporter
VFQSFYLSRRWMLWSSPGAVLILLVTWYKVQLDVRINEWFGDFYNLVQKALSKPNTITLNEYLEQLTTFGTIAGLYVTVAVFTDFFIKHYVFRWRTAMTEYYATHWHTLRAIEGASQRVQEDTMRFARLVEGLGVSFMRSVMTLFAFLPILWTLSEKINELPWVGPISHSLVWVAIAFALAGTVLMAGVGIKLPGLEFENQRVEAAFRKELVYGEDDRDRATPDRFGALFADVRRNYFRLFFHYMYFDVARYSYLQFGVLVPYIALGPTLATGAITLGVMQQIVRAFGRVESSFQYLVNSWTTIVELISVYKRLRAFERRIVDVVPRSGTPLPDAGVL